MKLTHGQIGRYQILFLINIWNVRPICLFTYYRDTVWILCTDTFCLRLSLLYIGGDNTNNKDVCKQQQWRLGVLCEWTPPDVTNNNIFCRASRFSCRQLEEPTKREKKKQADEEHAARTNSPSGCSSLNDLLMLNWIVSSTTSVRWGLRRRKKKVVKNFNRIRVGAPPCSDL